jgi:hypothetical protein
MTGPNREIRLDEIPFPPLFQLVNDAGENVFQETLIGGEPAMVGTIFSSRELAEEFSENAPEFGMPALSDLEAGELPDRGAVETYADSGQDYVLVVTESGTGLFHASDVAAWAAEETEADGGMTFPLYLLTDERGESPLISVETGEAGEETLVAALFTSPQKARAFRDRASHLELPNLLGTIDERDGLRRHALVARQAGAGYAVIDPESGLTEAIPLEEWIG